MGESFSIQKEDMREAFGSEQWSPSAEDLEEVRRAEAEVRRMKKDGKKARWSAAKKAEKLARKGEKPAKADKSAKTKKAKTAVAA